MADSPRTLTVFTPAFNRAHTLPRTYQSLCRQTCKDFEWLIVDDGSSDNTAEIVKPWLENSDFPIRYIYQENQGMHGAHNTAYANITTELNVCIDSDDWMPDDAVEKIIHFWNNSDTSRIAGIIGLDIREDGSLIGTDFPETMKSTTLSDYYASGGKGDKKLVYRTDIVKQFPKYPIFNGENYVGLAYLYMLIDQKYQLLTLNTPLVVVEYQAEGSSNGMYRQYWRNPKGFAFFRKTEMCLAKTVKRRFMSCMHYVSSCIIARDKMWLKNTPKKYMTVLAAPFGLLLYFFIRHKVQAGAKMNIK